MMPDDELIQVGDHVTIAHTPHPLTWQVHRIESRIDPFGVILISGQTGRRRRETAANLHLHTKRKNA